MRYVIAKFEAAQREAVYRIYVTDTLYYYITANKAVKKRYCEIAGYSGEPKADDRTAEEIAADVIRRNGLIRKEAEDERI